MKIKNKRNFYIAGLISFMLLLWMGYSIYCRNKEYVIEEREHKLSEFQQEAKEDEASLKEWMQASEVEDKGEQNPMVTVFVSGAVAESKVITLPKDKRLIDAVQACGGLTEEADINQVNLSLKLEEEQHYVIPKQGEVLTGAQQSIVGMPQNNLASEDEKLNINTASVQQLKDLPGIGEVLAQRIIQKRNELGRFQSVEDLLQVSGIGEKKFNEMKEKVRVD